REIAERFSVEKLLVEILGQEVGAPEMRRGEPNHVGCDTSLEIAFHVAAKKARFEIAENVIVVNRKIRGHDAAPRNGVDNIYLVEQPSPRAADRQRDIA